MQGELEKLWDEQMNRDDARFVPTPPVSVFMCLCLGLGLYVCLSVYLSACMRERETFATVLEPDARSDPDPWKPNT